VASELVGLLEHGQQSGATWDMEIQHRSFLAFSTAKAIVATLVLQVKVTLDLHPC
jgi:hypothetical protein